jgi:hypothetical protein
MLAPRFPGQPRMIYFELRIADLKSTGRQFGNFKDGAVIWQI